MSIISTLLFTMLAGFMNGTYAFPIKYMSEWKDENIWLIFSPIAFVIMPWICLPMIDHQIIPSIMSMPSPLLSTLIVSGFLFGIGMIIFTYSLKYVGLGISFVLNISSSTVLAALLPIILMQPSKLISWFGLAEITALMLFCVAVFSSYLASCHKNKNESAEKNKRNIFLGVSLGILSGILTSAQGFSYAYVTSLLKTQTVGYSTLTIMSSPWIPIFSAAFIPYFAYFLFRNAKLKSFQNIISKKSLPYFALCLIMGVLYFGSLLVFSHASLSLGEMGAVIAWPMLMIFIILTSNLWSFIHQEWVNASKQAFRYLSISISTLIMAIIALSIAGYINT